MPSLGKSSLPWRVWESVVLGIERGLDETGCSLDKGQGWTHVTLGTIARARTPPPSTGLGGVWLRDP